MLYKCYLKNGVVYLPTTVNQGTARYLDVDPVTVVPVVDTEGLRGAMQRTIPEKNAFVPPSLEDRRRPPVLLKYTGEKSWSAFQRNASLWSIYEKDGIYQIEGYRRLEKGFERDANQTIDFPTGTSIDEVIDRMIVILRDAAAQ
jgi:hypothetical protein